MFDYMQSQGQQPNLVGGPTASGWDTVLNNAIRSKMPQGMQILLGSMGLKGMPSPGNSNPVLNSPTDISGTTPGAPDWASNPNPGPIGNKPLDPNAGMATPGMGPPPMQDPAAKSKGGGNGVASGMVSQAAKGGSW